MEKKGKSKIKTIITILTVLLCFSIAALGVNLIYNHFHKSEPASVTVPDNIITQDAAESSATSLPAESAVTNSTAAADTVTQKTAATIALHSKKNEDNTPFNVGNMFPGDSDTRYYCVKVTYQNTVNVRFSADIRGGYEKLAEVLNCKVTLLTTGQTLYDGLMKNMPESISTSLSSDAQSTDELYYQITAYLDTSVGNEYQNKDLVADFHWWVEETENLEMPETGDNSNLILWLGLVMGSALLILLLLLTAKRKEKGE